MTPVIDALQYANWSEAIFRQVRQGGVDAVHVTITYHETFRETVLNIETWNRWFERHSDLIFQEFTADDILHARRTGRTAIFFGSKNPSCIEDDIGLVEVIHRLGLRFMQLSYNNQSLLASGCYEEDDTGLTRMGREVVAEMNRVGLVVDMSHSGERSTLEAIEHSTRPVAITHANPSAWHPALRNKSDRVLRALVESGGIMGFSIYPHHLRGGNDCRLQEFCDMIARTAETYGVAQLGIGSDLCQDQPDSVVEWMRRGRWKKGTDYGEGSAEAPGFPRMPDWFAGNAGFPNLASGLRVAGLSEADVAALLGGNWARFFRDSFGGCDRGGTGGRMTCAPLSPMPEAAGFRRDAAEVMRLDRLGAAHLTRLSFLRVLLRRLGNERWRFDRPVFDLDGAGVGRAVYRAIGPERTYSLVAFGHDLPAEERSDRVIATAWDATFALFDGTPDAGDLDRLAANVPVQEAGRVTAKELSLSRANRSVRFFEHVVQRLSEGRQPDPGETLATGYLMRTSAVYGSGKFGAASHCAIATRPELSAPFQAEMLSVWLTRAFTVDLVEHMAQCRGGSSAAALDPDLRRTLGVGNATGLGMAPFLMRQPLLLNNWVMAREEALARVRAQKTAGTSELAGFKAALQAARENAEHWRSAHPVQMARLEDLRSGLHQIGQFVTDGWNCELSHPWDTLWRWGAGTLPLEAQEALLALLLEPHGALVDDLAGCMSADESAVFAIDGGMTIGELGDVLACNYDWAFGRDCGRPADEPVARLLLETPDHRPMVRRAQMSVGRPFAEIRDNLISADLLLIDMLRCKMAFFGATRFDPRSDQWVRISLYQGAPYPDELSGEADL